jgi:hypothetical protein
VPHCLALDVTNMTTGLSRVKMRLSSLGFPVSGPTDGFPFSHFLVIFSNSRSQKIAVLDPGRKTFGQECVHLVGISFFGPVDLFEQIRLRDLPEYSAGQTGGWFWQKTAQNKVIAGYGLLLPVNEFLSDPELERLIHEVANVSDVGEKALSGEDQL